MARPRASMRSRSSPCNPRPRARRDGGSTCGCAGRAAATTGCCTLATVRRWPMRPSCSSPCSLRRWRPRIAGSRRPLARPPRRPPGRPHRRSRSSARSPPTTSTCRRLHRLYPPARGSASARTDPARRDAGRSPAARAARRLAAARTAAGRLPADPRRVDARGDPPRPGRRCPARARGRRGRARVRHPTRTRRRRTRSLTAGSIITTRHREDRARTAAE